MLSGYQIQRADRRSFGVAGIDADGTLAFTLALPQRIHQTVVVNTQKNSSVNLSQQPERRPRQAVLVARRPGTHLYRIDIDAGKILQTISARIQRHFYGHAVVSHNHSRIYIPQNHLDEVASSLAVYSMGEQLQWMGEIPLPGIGPHQIEVLSDDSLVVAMGGILTRPSRGREKLNLATLKSSLLYIDPDSTEIVAQYKAPITGQSIRHLAVTSDDTVVVGMQYQFPQHAAVPLAYHSRKDGVFEPLQASEIEWGRHKHYVGSVCINEADNECVLSSPRGGVVSRWHMHNKQIKKIHSVQDVCGLAFDKKQQAMYWSNGLGQLQGLESNRRWYFPDVIWDNHMSYINNT